MPGKQGRYPTSVKLIVFALLLVSNSHAASLQAVAIVKFYSDGKLAARREAVDKGRQDENCYILHVRKGARETDVRVCGTFSVEQLRQMK